MRRFVLTVVILALIAGVMLFPDQVLAQFRGMTPLKAMKTIVTFILHVAVGTILAYAAYTLPEIVSPWLKALKRRLNGKKYKSTDFQKVQKTPRMSTDALMRAYMLQQMSGKSKPVDSAPRDDTRIDF